MIALTIERKRHAPWPAPNPAAPVWHDERPSVVVHDPFGWAVARCDECAAEFELYDRTDRYPYAVPAPTATTIPGHWHEPAADTNKESN